MIFEITSFSGFSRISSNFSIISEKGFGLEKEENLVKKTCRELGITQKELAEKMGVSETSISQWSNGKKSLTKNIENNLNLLCEYEYLKKEYEIFRTSILRKEII